MTPRLLTALTLLQTSDVVDVGPEQLTDYEPAVVRAGWFLLGFAVVVALGWYLFAPLVTRTVRRRNPDNLTIQEAMSRYLRLLSVVVAVFVGAGVAGYGGFLASSALVIAAATLAVGVAGQTVLGSLISGLVLVFDPEFNVGNYIEWDDDEGTIRSIALRVTRVENPDGELVTVPNTVLTGQAITRPYGRRRHRVSDYVAVSYEDDVEAALEALERAAETTECVLSEPEPRAYVDELGGDGVVLRTIYWVDDPRRNDLLRAKSRFAMNAKAELEKAEVEVSPASQRMLMGRIEVDEPEVQGEGGHDEGRAG